ncbi:MAG: NAD(P)H-dependent oxidoreductase [Spirochaetales bacterium]|nr:NAD(P)H-dependent oxidoreductase [Spirochaetales bacterium]
MNIIVINGSPKGKQSITMQYTAYLAKKRGGHTFNTLHVAAMIGRLENNIDAFKAAITKIRSADAVLWAFPVYYLLVSSQYKRFIELVFERNAESAFSGKPAVSLSTSIRFFDNMAHQYMRSIMDDLGMRCGGNYSAYMSDLTDSRERARLLAFFDVFLLFTESPAPFIPAFQPVVHCQRPYIPERPVVKVDTKGKRIACITDARPGDENLKAMIERFSAAVSEKAEIVNLREIDFTGGCLGCLRCGQNNRCVYEGRDDFIGLYRNIVEKADILVFAGTIAGRQLSAVWRRFFDRSFFNNHTPTLMNKQIAFLVSGPLKQLPDIRRPYEAWLEIQRANLIDFISDDMITSPALDAAIDQCARRLVLCADSGYVAPRTFYGIAGMKLFRDEIWGGLRFIFRADHKAYKRMGFYDFPQKRIASRLKIFIATLITGLPVIRKHFPSRIKSGMLEPFKKVVNEA